MCSPPSRRSCNCGRRPRRRCSTRRPRRTATRSSRPSSGSYDAPVRERDAILGLQRNIEQRTEQRAFVPESQRSAAGEGKKRGGLFGLELRALKESAAPGSVIAPDEWSANFFDKLSRREHRHQERHPRAFARSRDVLHVPRIDADPEANWTAEAATITPSDPAYTDLMATPRKLASLTVV